MPGISGIEGPAYLSWLAGLDYALSVITPGGTVRADIPDIMRAYEASQTDHIDLLAEPKGPPIR
jgi:hypothetical protein